jgi:NADH dehydrogenase
MKVTGFLGYVMWGFIHVAYLIGWGNRLGTLYTWARALWLSHNRGHRIITFEQANDQAHASERARGAPRLAEVDPLPTPHAAGGAAGAVASSDGPSRGQLRDGR